MKEVLIEKTKNRKDFVKRAFEYFKVKREIKRAKKILLKPNIVSFEPYPTTTHPEVLRACLESLLELGKEVIVADGPAFDAGNSQKIIENHPLKRVCNQFKIELINLNKGPFKKVKTKSFVFEISPLVSECDFIISLPVFKSHTACLITGALKNQYGFLSPKDKVRFHTLFGQDINKAIAELNQAIKIDFWIMDLVETLIGAQEVRHGGERKFVGYMLAGRNPVTLDTEGLKLLKKVDPSLRTKTPKDILHLKWAIGFRLGDNKRA